MKTNKMVEKKGAMKEDEKTPTNVKKVWEAVKRTANADKSSVAVNMLWRRFTLREFCIVISAKKIF